MIVSLLLPYFVNASSTAERGMSVKNQTKRDRSGCFDLICRLVLRFFSFSFFFLGHNLRVNR